MAVPWKLVVKFSRPAEISSYFSPGTSDDAGCVGGLSTDSRDTPPGASRGATVRGRSRGIARDASVVEAPIVRIVDQARRVRDARARFRPSLEFLDQVREDVPDHDKDRRRVQIVHRHVRGDARADRAIGARASVDLVDALLAPRGDASDDDAETFPRDPIPTRDPRRGGRRARRRRRRARRRRHVRERHERRALRALRALRLRTRRGCRRTRAQRQADVVASSVDAPGASLGARRQTPPRRRKRRRVRSSRRRGRARNARRRAPSRRTRRASQRAASAYDRGSRRRDCGAQRDAVGRRAATPPTLARAPRVSPRTRPTPPTPRRRS